MAKNARLCNVFPLPKHLGITMPVLVLLLVERGIVVYHSQTKVYSISRNIAPFASKQTNNMTPIELEEETDQLLPVRHEHKDVSNDHDGERPRKHIRVIEM